MLKAKVLRTICALSVGFLSAALLPDLPAHVSAAPSELYRFSLDTLSGDSVTDDTDKGITLTKKGDGTIQVVEGVQGNAVEFDGNVCLGIDGGLGAMGQQSYTISVYFRITPGNNNGRLFGSGGFGNSPCFWVRIGANDDILLAGAGSEEGQVIGYGDHLYRSSNISDGEWHSVTLVMDFDQKLMQLYIDGMPDSVLPWDNPDITRGEDGTILTWTKEYAVSSDQAFAIGAGGNGPDGYGEFFKGAVDEFVMYDGAMTQDEVRALYGLDPLPPGESEEQPASPSEPETPSEPEAQPSGNNGRSDFPNNLEMPAIRDTVYEQLAQKLNECGENSLETKAAIPMWIWILSSIGAGAAVLSLVFVAVLLFSRRKAGTASKKADSPETSEEMSQRPKV